VSEPLDEFYFKWLYSQVGSVRQRNTSKTYWSLLRQLYAKEFVWVVPNDDNRVEDGRELRHQFIEDLEIVRVDRNWMELGCSFLEMLVALSRRLAFETEGEPLEWFWVLIANLGLQSSNDRTPMPPEQIEEILNTVIWRTYNVDGAGGLFPLRSASQNQQKVEIWYQLCAYLLEQS